jgi:hypothetical protein
MADQLKIDGKVGGLDGLAALHVGWLGGRGDWSFQVYFEDGDRGNVTVSIPEPVAPETMEFIKALVYGEPVSITIAKR